MEFARIMDDEYRDAIKRPPVTPAKTFLQHNAAEAAKPDRARTVVSYIAAVSAGLITRRLIRNRH